MTTPIRARNDEWIDEDQNNTNNIDLSEMDFSEPLSSNNSYDYKFKICVLGDSGVGKTSIINRFINNHFFDDEFKNSTDNEQQDELNFTKSRSTIGIDCLKSIRVLRGHKIMLEVWDTAGQERFNAITTSYLREANAVILVYDISSFESFDNVQKKWLEFAKQNLSSNEFGVLDARLAIVGNKLDLADERVVAKKAAVKLSTTNSCRFFEASAKTGRNVQELFRGVCDLICDYWCDLRGNPSFFPPDAKKRINLHNSQKEKDKKHSSGCAKC